MGTIAFASAKASPGVTTCVAALAATWPVDRDLYVAELDPAGAELAVRLDLAPEPGLVSLAAAGRRDLQVDTFVAHTQPLPFPAGGATRRVLVGPVAAEQAGAALGALRAALPAMLARVPGDVLVDCGRLDPGSPVTDLATGADLLVMVARPDVAEVHHLAARLASLRPRAVALLTVGDTPYPVTEVAEAVGATPLGTLPAEPRAAEIVGAAVAGSLRTMRRSRLLRDARALAEGLASWLGGPAGPLSPATQPPAPRPAAPVVPPPPATPTAAGGSVPPPPATPTAAGGPVPPRHLRSGALPPPPPRPRSAGGPDAGSPAPPPGAVVATDAAPVAPAGHGPRRDGASSQAVAPPRADAAISPPPPGRSSPVAPAASSSPGLPLPAEVAPSPPGLPARGEAAAPPRTPDAHRPPAPPVWTASAEPAPRAPEPAGGVVDHGVVEHVPGPPPGPSPFAPPSPPAALPLVPPPPVPAAPVLEPDPGSPDDPEPAPKMLTTRPPSAQTPAMPASQPPTTPPAAAEFFPPGRTPGPEVVSILAPLPGVPDGDDARSDHP